MAIFFTWIAATPAAAETFTSAEILSNSITLFPSDPDAPGAIVAKFTPNNGLTLDDAASACGVDHFNWVQTVVALPAGWTAEKIFRSNGTLVGTLDAAFYDPLDNSVDYALQIATPAGIKQVVPLASGFRDKNPCYYGEDWAKWGQPGNLYGNPQVVFSKALTFYDRPSMPDDVWGLGTSMSFLTQLVGVNADGTTVSFNAPGISFAWTTNAAHDHNVQSSFLLALVPGSNLPPVITGGISDMHLVPEPSCTALLCVGFACLFVSAWRRRKQAA